MDDGQAWLADLDDLDEEPEDPDADQDFWEDDELTAEELTRWQDAVQAAERADRARACPGLAGTGPGRAGGRAAEPDDASRQAEGSVPDLIGAVLAAAGELALMSDAELIESMVSWHVVGARAAGRELRATEELLRRRKPRVWDRRADRAQSRREDPDRAVAPGPGKPQSRKPGPGVPEPGAPEPEELKPGEPGPGAPERVMPAVVASREAAAEIALALTATGYAAQAQAELTADLSRRLPLAFSELDAGRADLRRVQVLAEGTQFLSDPDAGRVDALLAPRLGQQTTGDLRDKIRKAIIRIDPAAADRRASHAARKARFALYANEDHTATAAVERMPAHLGAAVKARVNAIARAAKAAGMTGPMPLLEAKIATGLLLDTLPHIPPPRDDGTPPGGPGDLSGPGAPGAPGAPGDPGPEPGPWNDGWPDGWFPGPSGPPTPAADDPADNDPAEDDPAGDDPAAEDVTGDYRPSLDGPGTDDDRDADDSDADDSGREDFGPANFTLPAPDSGGAGAANFTQPDSAGEMSWPGIPVQAGWDGPGCYGLPGWLRPKVPGRIRLTVPWRTLTGISLEPGELSWIGPVTPAQARDLAAAAAGDPSCGWQLVITDDDGHAIAVTTLRTRRPATTRPPGLVSEVTITITQSTAAALGRDGRARDWTAAALARLASGQLNTASGTGGVNFTEGAAGAAELAKLTDLLARAIPTANIAAREAAARAAADAAAGGCAHLTEAPGYRVPGRLRRWLSTRDRTCRHPGCRQPASRCDQDHTLAYHRGGRTCPCNLGGLCRLHHELKQLPGWELTQDSQGHFTWRTPAGLTYRKEPYRYPV